MRRFTAHLFLVALASFALLGLLITGAGAGSSGALYLGVGVGTPPLTASGPVASEAAAQTTDAAATALRLIGGSAYPQATVNTTGANLSLAPGTGRRFFTSVSNTAGAVVLTITVDGSAVTLTSGADFTLGSDNTAPQLAVTATNLAAAINANGTLSAALTAAASTSSVYLTKSVGTRSVIIATDQAGRISTTSGADGVISPWGMITVPAGLGATATHIIGPSDQDFLIRAPAGHTILLRGDGGSANTLNVGSTRVLNAATGATFEAASDTGQFKIGTSADTGLGRSAAGIVKVTNGGAGSGGLNTGPITIADGGGAVSQIVGPSDQNMVVSAGASPRTLDLNGTVSGVYARITKSGSPKIEITDQNITTTNGDCSQYFGGNGYVTSQGVSFFTGAGAQPVDAGISRAAAGVVRVHNGVSTGYGSLRAEWPRRTFSVAKTPGTAATLTAVGGTPTHTLTGTAANLSDSTGAYVTLTASGAATGGVDIATTECVKTEIGPIVTFTFKTGADLPVATERIWVGLSSASLATADSPTGAHVVAFRYAPTVDGTLFWRFVTNDGGADTGTTGVTSIAIAASTRYVVTFDSTDPASIKGYINGTLDANATSTTNLPTVTQALGCECLVRDTVGGADKLLSISKINYETN